jgi:predicted RNA binding protein YcfA (HicA-like mRNA interferase family)
MAKKVKFSELRQLLESMGFETQRGPSHVVFEHRPSETVIVLRSYSARELVSLRELDVVQTMLDQRGLMESGTFERAWQDAPA